LPFPTFENLPEEKKKRIIDAAMDEFSENSYNAASLNRIVKAAGISKGSLYQYFADKRDLYFFLLDRIAQEKLKLVQKTARDASHASFFEVLGLVLQTALELARTKPRYALIANRMLDDRQVEEEVLQRYGSSSDSFFQPLLARAIQQGEVKGDLDIELVSKLLTACMLATGEYMIEKHGEYNEREAEKLFHSLFDLFENGLKRRGSGE